MIDLNVIFLKNFFIFLIILDESFVLLLNIVNIIFFIVRDGLIFFINFVVFMSCFSFFSVKYLYCIGIKRLLVVFNVLIVSKLREGG